MFYSRGDATSIQAFWAGICQGTFEIVSSEVLWSIRRSSVPRSRMLHDIPGAWQYTVTAFIRSDNSITLTRDLVILLPTLTLLPHIERFRLNIYNGCDLPKEDAYRSGHLSLSHLGLACILMFRQLVCPKLVISPDLEFEISFGISILYTKSLAPPERIV